MTSQAKPQLHYWDFRGLGEPIRYLLRYLQVDFEDHRIPLEEGGDIPTVMQHWLNQKHSHGLHFPNIPFYVDENGLKVTQTLAILRYIGKTHNLAGSTPQEEAIVDMVAQTSMDFRFQNILVYISPKYQEIKEEWKATLPERFGEVSKFLEGKQFILGDKISYVDFFLYEMVKGYRQFAPEVFEESPELHLNKFQKIIEAVEWWFCK